jgi:charged multivesicular body protein 6
MGNSGGKDWKSHVDDHDRAVLDLKNARDTLKQYQKKLNTSMDREKEVARLLLKKGNKQGALWVLKKKKLQESMLEKTHVQLDNVQQMIDSIDFAQINARVFESLQQGRDALKELNNVMSVDDVEQLLEDNADQIKLAQELDDAVQQHMGGKMTAEDELDIEAEYNRLLDQESAEQPTLPDAPVHDIKQQEQLQTAKAKADATKKKITG